MIKVAQAYCGPDWMPSYVETRATSSGVEATLREEATGIPWHFDAAANGIVFPSAALWAQRAPEPGKKFTLRLSSRDVLAEIRVRRQDSDIDRLAAIITLRLIDGQTDIDGVARMVGISRRTLQRWLDAQGVTYRALLDRVRLERARALVLETEAPLSEIAMVTGYSDHAHFTRAFGRHFGRSPSAERGSEPGS
jgi:AraC-like DNA-binding protein